MEAQSDGELTISAEFLLEQISRFILECQKALADGDHVELAGLDHKVGLLCKAVTRMPRDEGEKFADHLETLVGALDALKHSMELERLEAKRQLDGISLQRKAHVAYSKQEPGSPQEES